MHSSYDECLEDGVFFQSLQKKHKDLVEKAVEKGWIVCIPRQGTYNEQVTVEDVLEHVLVPQEGPQYRTLTKRDVLLQNKSLVVEGETIHILFEETFYIDRVHKYTLWCLERPLNQGEMGISLALSLRDSIKLLWSNSRVAHKINEFIHVFLASSLGDSLEVLQHNVHALYGHCTNVVSEDTNAIAVEMYIQHNIHEKLFESICHCTWKSDAAFNKMYRNVCNLQLSDLELEHLESVLAGTRTLSSINSFTTIVEKMECLHRVANIFNTTVHYVTAEDMLKIFVFLIVKSNINNWNCNLMYITYFRMNPLKHTDEDSFLVATLEAAIKYIRSGSMGMKNVAIPAAINTLGDIFDCIKAGGVDAIKEIFGKNNLIKVKVQKVECHPLCCCDKCNSSLACGVNSYDDQGLTPLHISCLHNQPHIVEYLISCGANVDVRDCLDLTPLHYAAATGNQNAVLLLLHSNALINPRNSNGDTPLHLAASMGHESCVKALIYFTEQKEHVEVNLLNNLHETALHLAARWGYEGICQILLQYGADTSLTNRRGQNAGNVAQNAYLRRLFAMIHHRSNSSNNTIEHTKPSTNDPKPHTSHHKMDVVLKAAENNDLPLICFYLGIPMPLNVHSNISATSHHPLCSCTSCGKEVKTLLPSKATPKGTVHINDCSADGLTVLHIAASCGHHKMLRLLLDTGAAVDAKTCNGETPLHLACKWQHLEVIRELLQCGGCNFDMQDSSGNSPLHYACTTGNARIVECLLSHGCDCTLRNIAGLTPLEEARRQTLFDVVAVIELRSQSNKSADGHLFN